MITGIDVSAYQPSAYDLSGAEFVFVKATEGISYTNPLHTAQVARARTNGRVVGHYHYLNASSMSAQMDYLVRQAGAAAGDVFAVDWEETAVTSAQKDAALKYLQNRVPGHRVVLYCNQDFWLNRDQSSYCADGLWIAQYNGHPGAPGIKAAWLVHQYTSSPVDTNVAAFSSRAAMAAWAAGETEDTVTALTKDDGDLVVDRILAADKFDAPTDAADYSADPASPGHYWSGRTLFRDLMTRVRALGPAVAAVQKSVDSLEAPIMTDAQVDRLAAGLAGNAAFIDKIADTVAANLAARLES